MKNLDIEKLERKNIYQIPDNFFETVQANVLRETVHKIQPAVEMPVQQKTALNPKWWYAAAAAVALVFGMAFFFINNEQPEETLVKNKVPTAADFDITEENTPVIAATPDVPPATYAIAPAQKETPQVKQKTPVQQKMTIAKNEIPKKTIIAKPKAEEEVEQILDVFTTEEIAMLANNMEQDIYLDIYN